MKPDWIVKLEAEPCRCERCSFCCGRGNIRVDDHSQPEGWDLETCDQCSGGIVGRRRGAPQGAAAWAAAWAAEKKWQREHFDSMFEGLFTESKVGEVES